MSRVNFLGLAVVVVVDLLGVAFSTWCVFWLLRRLERYVIRNAANDKPNFSVIVVRLAVGMFVAACVFFSTASIGAGISSPVFSTYETHGTLPGMLAGRGLRVVYGAVVATNIIFMSVVMLCSFMLGTIATVGGIRRKDKRAIYFYCPN